MKNEYIELNLKSNERDVGKIEEYYYMRWMLEIYLYDGETDERELIKTFIYRLDEKQKIFEDYFKSEEMFKELLKSSDMNLEYKILYEPF